MRILVFLPALTLGGAERQGLFVARHLQQRGHDVEVWGFPPPGNTASLIPELRLHQVKHHELPCWPQFDWQFASSGGALTFFRGYYRWLQRLRWFAATLPSRKYDAVIPFTFWPSLITCLLRRRLGARKCYWSQRGGYDDAGLLYNRFLVRQIKAQRPRFVANSGAGAKFLQDTFKLASAQVTVIPNVYVEDAGCAEDLAADVHHSPSDEIRLIHVANFYPEKDYDTVLRALQILAAEGVQCRLHICGAFPRDTDEPLFFARVRELNIDHCIVHHGALPRRAVLQLVGGAHIGILSSKSEGQPNAVMEYMEKGLPVVATNIPGIREIVGDANEPYLFQPGDAQLLAEHLKTLIRDPLLRRTLGAANRERITTCFRPERILPRWAELVEND